MEKQIIAHGHGELPAFAEGAKASIHFKCRIRGEKDLLDDSRDLLTEAPFDLRIGKGFVLASWEDAVKTMRLGEKATFEMKYEMCAAYSQLALVLRRNHREASDPGHENSGGCSCARGATLADSDLHEVAGKTLKFEFELIRVEEPGAFERQSWEISLKEKAENIPLLKEAGNVLFKQHKYAEAQQKYLTALGYIESIELKSATATEQVVIDGCVQIALLLNFAACKLKLRDYPATVKYTTMVLEQEPTNVKALFRRGQAHLSRGRDLDLAKADLDTAARFAPTNTGIQAALAGCHQAIAASKAKDASMYKGMF